MEGEEGSDCSDDEFVLAFAAFLLVGLGPPVCVIDGNLIEIWWEMVIYRHLLRNNLT